MLNNANKALFLQAYAHHFLQAFLISQQFPRIRIMVATKAIEPKTNFFVPQLTRIILHSLKPHIAILHLIGISHLFGQR